MFTHYAMLGADQGFCISELVRSQTFSREGATSYFFQSITCLLELSYSEWENTPIRA